MPSYKVKMVDGSWYTLGSGSQAKIRALDGSWYVENNAAPPEAKVRLLAGAMGPGVPFGPGTIAYPGAYQYVDTASAIVPSSTAGSAAWQNVGRLADFTTEPTAPGFVKSLVPDGTGQYFCVYQPSTDINTRYDPSYLGARSVFFLSWDITWASSLMYPWPYRRVAPAGVVGWQYLDGPTHIGDRTAPYSAAEIAYFNTPLSGAGVWDGNPDTFGITGASANFNGPAFDYEPWELSTVTPNAASTLSRDLYLQTANVQNDDYETRAATYRSGTANVENEASWSTWESIPLGLDGTNETFTVDLGDFSGGLFTVALTYRGSDPGIAHLGARQAVPRFTYRPPPVRYLWSTSADAIADGGTGESVAI